MLLMWAYRCGDTPDNETPKETTEMQHAALLKGCGTGAEKRGCCRTMGRDRGQDRGVS